MNRPMDHTVGWSLIGIGTFAVLVSAVIAVAFMASGVLTPPVVLVGTFGGLCLSVTGTAVLR